MKSNNEYEDLFFSEWKPFGFVTKENGYGYAIK